MSSMKTVACIAQKGGVGKTTISTQLAAMAASRGHRVLVLDLDPQASAVKWGRNCELAGCNFQTTVPALLRDVLKRAANDGVELAVIDTAPNADQASLEAARTADLVLIPVAPKTAALAAIGATIDTARMAKKPMAVVLNDVPIQGQHGAEAGNVVMAAGVVLAPVMLRHRVAVEYAWRVSTTVEDYEPGGKAAEEWQQLYRWVTERLRLNGGTVNHSTERMVAHG